ncbi:MAG: toxin-antitoxin system YwqK family antitoxin [Candidatus Zixiibacteriota bacterium]
MEWLRTGRFLPIRAFAVLVLFSSAAEAQVACPKGTIKRGARPPGGSAVYCEKRLPSGKYVIHGWYYEFYENGKIRRKIKYKLGRRNGPLFAYNIMGWKEGVMHYRDDKLHGKMVVYYASGRVHATTFYRRGLKHGQVRHWYPSGRRKMLGHYRKNKLHGKILWWFKNGKLKMAGSMQKGKPHGLWKEWDRDGNRTSTCRYRHGRKIRCL